MDSHNPQRRRLLAGCAGAAAGLLLARPLTAGTPARGARELAFRQLHTGERLTATYWEDGTYLPDALEEINHLLRDHRTGEVHPIDPGLLDTLVRLRRALGTSKEFRVISGYRSARTNAALRRVGAGGVAKRSLHMLGQAIDVRLPGRSTRQVQQAALSLRAGGVGYYEKDAFVHLDTGRVRQW